MNEELLERIAIALEKLVAQQQLKLGFGESPAPQYIFIGQEVGQGLWYSLDGDSQIWHQKKSLTGVITALEIVNKQYKNKEQTKLDITVQADKTYIIRTGFGTVFCKGLLLALNTLDAKTIKRPLAITVSPGEETVVFCRVYDAVTKTQLQAEWNPDADWSAILYRLQELLKSSQVETPEIWRSWKNPEEAILWAVTQLPELSTAAIEREFAKLPATNGKKAPAWVERVNQLKGF